MSMKKLLIIIVFGLYAITSFSQILKVMEMEEAIFDLTAATNPRYDINGKIGALVKIQLPEVGATFENSMILGDVEYRTGEYYVYMASGAKRLTIKYPHCLPLNVDFTEYGINSLETKSTYVLKIVINHEGFSKFKKKSIYMEPFMQIGNLTAFGGSIGGYVGHLNVEVSYLIGLSESEEIYWNNTSGTNASSPGSYTYKPTFIGGKVGYAFYIGKPFRVTPQVGMGVVSLKGTEKKNGDTQLDAQKGYALNASISGRIDYLILPWLGIGLSPELSLSLSRSDLYERVSDVSTKIDGFAKGFNVKLGVFFNF